MKKSNSVEMSAVLEALTEHRAPRRTYVVQGMYNYDNSSLGEWEVPY